MLCTADDDKCRLHLAVSGAHSEAGESVAENFARALPPVSKNADAGLEPKVDRIDDHAVRSRARDGKEEALAAGMLEGSGEAESDVAEIGVDKAARGPGNIPGKIELLGEDVGGAAGKKSERNAIAVAGGGQAVDDFVERAVAAAGNDELAVFTDGLLSDLGGMAGTSGLGKLGFDAIGRQDATGLVEQLAPAITAVAGVGIVNEKSVMER